MNFTKCILLSLVLIAILSLSGLCVSAADNPENTTLNNDSTCVQISIDLNSDNPLESGEAAENITQENITETINLENINDLCNITQTSKNTFIMSLPNNLTLSICPPGSIRPCKLQGCILIYLKNR